MPKKKRINRRKDISNCTNCGKQFHASYDSSGIFCSNKCQQDLELKAWIDRYLKGLEKGWTGKTKQLSSPLRRYLFQLREPKCEICGWCELHPIDNKPLVEIDHIDGDAENCTLNNLKIVCPNHHSMTSTFRNRNKNSKRNRKAL